MSVFYDNYVRLCNTVGKTPSAAALEIGISKPTVSRWKTGSKPNRATVLKVADYFGVPADALTGVPAREGGRSDSIRIPVLGSVPAGIPIEAVEDILDWEEIPSSMCRGGKEYFALKVKGDSMWPVYLPGDVVIVRKAPDCESGDDCIVYVNGYEATLKKVKFGEDGSLSIIPNNQNYSPRTYTREQVEALPVSIAGVVVELRRKIGMGESVL